MSKELFTNVVCVLVWQQQTTKCIVHIHKSPKIFTDETIYIEIHGK